MNLDQLNVFQTVAHQGNFTKAAKKLILSNRMYCFHVIQKYVKNGDLIAHSSPKSILNVKTVFIIIRRHDIFMSNALNRFIEMIRNQIFQK